MNNIYKSDKVYELVKKIPRGKVVTYGWIAARVGLKSPRTVGQILHRNPDPGNIPCHRVVNSKGEMASAFAFGGSTAQAAKLKAEGVIIGANGKTDLHKYIYLNEEVE